MNIPCRENKCILLPICKNKFEIECQILADFYGKETGGTYDSRADVWDDIEKTLPKLIEVHGPMVLTKTLAYRSYKIYKYPDPGHLPPGYSLR